MNKIPPLQGSTFENRNQFEESLDGVKDSRFSECQCNLGSRETDSTPKRQKNLDNAIYMVFVYKSKRHKSEGNMKSWNLCQGCIRSLQPGNMNLGYILCKFPGSLCKAMMVKSKLQWRYKDVEDAKTMERMSRKAGYTE